MNIPIVYEDEWLLVADKPSGLLVIPTPKNESRTLTSIFNEDLKQKGIGYRLHPCHRLDRETSGLIIYAKGKSIQKKIMQEFKDKKVKKEYLAFIQGAPARLKGEISNPIDGKNALTRYEIIAQKKNFSVVKVSPKTGRTNQIRIHFKQLGCPLLGETRYAFRRDFQLKAKRLCLHAQKLEFVHPVTKNLISLAADLPPAMQEIIKKCG